MYWRWDQGRGEYFRFSNIKRIAKALIELEGIHVNNDAERIREVLKVTTGLTFPPPEYKPWRNYARVFGCSLLAISIEDKLVTSGVCGAIIAEDNPLSSDEYFGMFVRRFCYDFPIFDGYSEYGKVFPCIAVLKLLWAKASKGEVPRITTEEAFSTIISNQCTGYEAQDYYESLVPLAMEYSDNQRRQVRELLIFMSQLSILKWHEGALYMDYDSKETGYLNMLATPDVVMQKHSKEEQFLEIARLGERWGIDTIPNMAEEAVEKVFTEGRRVRVTHLMIERSPSLRRIFFEVNKGKIQCDICGIKPNQHYPWVDNMLELHHILPLSSSLGLDERGTSLDDIRALCPNCHKGIHLYYKKYLNEHDVEDFTTEEHSKKVYEEARKEFVE